MVGGGALALGGALQDLAWFLVLSHTMHGHDSDRSKYLPGMGTREETIALWEQISGKSAAFSSDVSSDFKSDFSSVFSSDLSSVFSSEKRRSK
mgnify:CR=1 FL=1